MVVVGDLTLGTIYDAVDAGLVRTVQWNVFGRLVDACRPFEMLLVHTGDGRRRGHREGGGPVHVVAPVSLHAGVARGISDAVSRSERLQLPLPRGPDTNSSIARRPVDSSRSCLVRTRQDGPSILALRPRPTQVLERGPIPVLRN